MKKWILVSVIALSFIYCKAAYLQDVPTRLVQPNGKIINCFITGDEFYRYVHDSLGYTIVKNPQTNYYVYALPAADSLTYSSYVVGEVDPSTLGLPLHVRWSAEKILAKRKAWEAEYALHQTRKSQKSNNRGVMNNLVIFISFADDTAFTYTDYPTECSKFNDSSSATAVSVYNYYRTVSYGQFYLLTHFFPVQSDTTVISYHDIYNRAYYSPYDAYTNPQGYTTSNERTTREHMLLHRAVEAVKSQIPSNLNLDYDNDGMVDNIAFIINGTTDGWNELLWPHRWSLYTSEAITYINNLKVYDYNFLIESDNTVGVITHELMHTLGAPDLYHYSNTDITPVGKWDLMASTNRGKPQGMGAYVKYKYGKWIDAPITITQPGTYTLYPANGTTTDKIAYQIPIPGSDEYFVLEYRRALYNSFDSPLNGSGILIYRINPNFHGNSDYDGLTKFDEIYLYRPNGTPTNNGNLDRAHFNAVSGRDNISGYSNPYLFLSNGTIVTKMIINSITNAEDSIQFSFFDNITRVTVNKTKIQLSSDLGEKATDTITVSATGHWTIQNADTSWLQFSTLSGDSGVSYVYISAKYRNYIHSPLRTSINFASLYNSVQVSIQQEAAAILECGECYSNMGATDSIQNEILPDNLPAIGESFALTDTVVSDSISIYFGDMTAINENDSVKVEIWDNSNGLKPVNRKRTILIPVKEIKSNSWHSIHLSLPVVLTGSFTIVYYTHTVSKDGEGQAIPFITADHTGKLDVYGTLLQKRNYVWQTLKETALNGKRTVSAAIAVYLCPQSSSNTYLKVTPMSLTMSSKKNDEAVISIATDTTWQVCYMPQWLKASDLSGNGTSLLTLTTTEDNNLGVQKDTICIRIKNHVSYVQLTRNPLTIYVDKPTLELDYLQSSLDSFKVITSFEKDWNMSTSQLFTLQYDTNLGTQVIKVMPKQTNISGREIEETIYIYNQVDTTFILIKQKDKSNKVSEAEFFDCKVYPNPANQILNIQISPTLIQGIEIFNMIGQRVISDQNINQSNATIDVSRLSKGIYVLKIYTANGLYNYKFSIK